MSKKFWLLISVTLFLSCAKVPGVKNIDSNGKNIICFGDSITYGKGASLGNAYPSLLAKKLNFPVINAGINGDTTRAALKRLKRDVLDKDPLLVIIELGANDYFKGIKPQETVSNLEQMIKKIQSKGAMVAITEIHSGYIMRELAIGIRKLAKKYRCIFIPNILEGILGEKALCSDTFHPNDKGYQIIAERVFKAVKPVLDKNLKRRKAD